MKFSKFPLLALTFLVLVFAAPPSAKGTDVHNKAPGIELTKEIVKAPQVNAPVVFEVDKIAPTTLEISPGDLFVATIKTEKLETVKNILTIEPPNIQRRRNLLSDYDFKRPLLKWKDIHLKVFFYS